jgi:hypothetical protein
MFQLLAAVATIAGTTASVYGQVEAGKAQEEQAEIRARQEKMAAEARELQRRQELNKVLAANAVSMAAGGVSGVTPESIALQTSKEIGPSEQVISVSEKLKRAQIKRQGALDRGTANIQATSTLLKSMPSVVGAYETITQDKNKGY